MVTTSGATPHARKQLLSFAFVVSTACAHGDEGPLKTVRFDNADVVWQVDDRQPVETRPSKNEFYRNYFFFQELLVRPTDRALSAKRFSRARNVNALGEVPDSTWFTTRIGRRSLTPEQIRRGPPGDGPPEPEGPLWVHEAEWDPQPPRLLVEDPRGHRYVLKFDQATIPENESAADVIVQRLLWACGFNVPEDDIVYFSREALVLAEDAVRARELGDDVPLDTGKLDEALKRVARTADGRFRGLFSKYLPGEPLGGYAVRGTREGDPNDIVPHEYRRELRGQHVFFAWVEHTDVKPDNWLDIWVEDPPGSDRHHVEHYLLDFGKALGNLAWIDRYPEDGFAHLFDFGYAVPSLFSLGLYNRPWDAYRVPDLRGVGRFGISAFNPASWKPYYPFLPFKVRDALDDYWAAKIVMRFSRAHVKAAVDAGQLSAAESRKYLVDTLVRRQRMIGRWAFSRVPPFERFEFRSTKDETRLCFFNLWERYGFDTDTETVLRPTRATIHDEQGQLIGVRALSRAGPSRWCTDRWPKSWSSRGYTIVVLDAVHGGSPLPPIHVHGARAPASDRLRVIGLYRLRP
jgi:hypothetical protein